MADAVFKLARNQTGYWLNAERLRVYSIIFIAVYLAAAVIWVSLAEGMVDRTNKPLGYDFTVFWSASKMALDGDPLGVFDQQKIFAAEHALIPAQRGLFPWNYPPQYLLVVLPLSLLPYVAAFVVWALCGLGLYLFVVHRFAPIPLAVLVTAAFPATMWNMTHGQNGFLITALFGASMLLLERRPWLAGVLIGLMSFKPHIGILIPLALLFGRHWAAFWWATATTIAFALLSTAVFGPEVWSAFWQSLAAIRTYVEIGANPLARMTSLFTALRLLDVGVTTAYALQIVGGIAVAATVAWVWARGTPLSLRAAVLLAGTPLITPYVFDYDLALLAIPIALIATDGIRRGWFRAEREILILAWATPLLATNLAVATGIHIGYLCVFVLFLVAVRRAVAPDHVFIETAVAV